MISFYSFINIVSRLYIVTFLVLPALTKEDLAIKKYLTLEYLYYAIVIYFIGSFLYYRAALKEKESAIDSLHSSVHSLKSQVEYLRGEIQKQNQDNS